MVMHFQVKWIRNGRNKIFREKNRAKMVLLMFVDIKRVAEREQFYFWTVSKNKHGMYLTFKILKISNEKGQIRSES